MDQIKGFFFSPIGYAVLIGILSLLVLRFLRGKRNCWKEMGIPFVEPLPLFGSLLSNIEKPLHEVEMDRYKKYGEVYGYFEGPRPMLSVADPKFLRNILVKDFQFFTDRRTLRTGDELAESMVQNLTGEDWKRVRTIITPTFTTGKIKRMLDIFTNCSKVLVKNFETEIEKGEPIDAKKFYGAYTMDVIASSAFSTKIDSHNDPNNEFIRKAKTVFGGNINYRFLLYVMFPGIVRFFKVPIFPQEGVKFFSEKTRQIIEERKKTGQKRNDFLQLLLDTAEEQQVGEEKTKIFEKKEELLKNYESETNDDVFKSVSSSRKGLSFTELVAQCIIFFLAGYETTASTLSFATYYLALNEDVQENLHEEVVQHISRCNGKLTYEAVQGMKYLDNVISETLRISPPASRLERVASEEYELEAGSIVIPKDAVVSVPVHAIHHEEKYYPDPEKFDPNRFITEARAARDPYTFIPFGAGPRNCVGMRFALVEAKVCLAYVISYFKIKRCAQTKVPLDYKKGVNLLHPQGIIVNVIKRKDCPLTE